MEWKDILLAVGTLTGMAWTTLTFFLARKDKKTELSITGNTEIEKIRLTQDEGRRKEVLEENDRLKAKNDELNSKVDKEIERRREMVDRYELEIANLDADCKMAREGNLQKITELQFEVHAKESIIHQLESDIRFFYDDVDVCYWEADEKGDVVLTNQAFLDVTGLTPEETRGRLWMAQILEKDRHKIEYLWNSFIGNTGTQIAMDFTFVNKLTNLQTEVHAQGKAVFRFGNEVYKFRVRTRRIEKR